MRATRVLVPASIMQIFRILFIGLARSQSIFQSHHSMHNNNLPTMVPLSRCEVNLDYLSFCDKRAYTFKQTDIIHALNTCKLRVLKATLAPVGQIVYWRERKRMV